MGSLIWPIAATYSADANKIYGTQKMEYVGGGNYNPNTVTNDLLSSNPVVLKVLQNTHWAAAVGILADTFSLNDPAHNKTKLSDSPYNNNAFQMRRYKKTASDFSFFEVSALSPTQLLIIDSLGRKTGYDETTNSVLEEIPNSYYYFESAIADDTGENPPPAEGSGIYVAGITHPQEDKYTVKIIGENGQLYSIATHGSDRNGEVLFDLFEATPSAQQQHELSFNYSPEPVSDPLALEIPIDIKPGHERNVISCDKNAYIRIAALTTEAFDARKIDHNTVTFEGATEIHHHNNKPGVIRHETDIDQDGDTDLEFHFYLNNTGLTCESAAGTLKGKTFDGLPVSGTDKVNMQTDVVGD